MSFSALIALIAVTSLWVLPGSSSRTAQSDSVASLLFKGEIQKAETLLNSQPKTTESVALGNFILDTGAATTVLSHDMAAEVGVNENTPGARVGLGLAGIGGVEGVVLRVPNVIFKTARSTEVFPQVVAIDLEELSKMFGTEVSGMVGFDFLQDVRVTLDYRAAEVRLSK